MKTIAANCHCSETAAREAIAALEQKGFIRRVKRYQDRPNGSVRQTSNAYYIQEQPPLPVSWGHTSARGGGVIYEQDERERLNPSGVGHVPASVEQDEKNPAAIEGQEPALFFAKSSSNCESPCFAF